MADLKAPLRKHLEEGWDEADVQRTWRGVQRRLARREVEGGHRALRAMAMGSALAAAAFCLWLIYGSRHTPGPLRLAAGPLPTELGSHEITRTDLSDGSHVTLAPNSDLEVLQNSGDAFVVVLRHGRSSFDVKPGGPRRWVIECGIATVEVVGTAFSIQRDEGAVGVSVDRGVVMVRGEGVPGRERRLTAGERIDIGESHAAEAAPPPAVAPEESAAAPEAVPDAGAAVLSPIHAESHSSAVSASSAILSESVASATVAPATIDAAVPPADRVDTMLREADRAQRAGDKRHAAEVLHRVVDDARGDPRAAFAAFTLARLTMDEDPHASAAALSSMLDAGVPRGLEEDVRARLVEAYSRAGDTERAREAAADYQRRFPSGSRAAEVRRWAGL